MAGQGGRERGKDRLNERGQERGRGRDVRKIGGRGEGDLSAAVD